MPTRANNQVLSERERLLREEIVNVLRNGAMAKGNDDGADLDALGNEYEHGGRGPSMPAAASPPHQTLKIDPQHAQILGADVENAVVETSFGEFNLNEIEVAQVAAICRQAVTRSLQDVLSALGDRYGIPELEAAIEKQTEMFRNGGAVATTQPVPQSNASVVEAEFTHEDDELDEENMETVVPLNKPRPKKQKRTNAHAG